MANTKENEAPGDVELRNRQTSTVDRPAPPNVLEQAWLWNLELFHTELESGNHPLDFKAGRGQFFNRTPLHLAAMKGHDEIVEFILRRPEISREVVNSKDDFGYTPLHLAVRHSRESVVQLLTTSSVVLPDRFLGATNEPDDLGEHYGGYTPLHLAAVTGHIAVAKLLLRQPYQVEFAYNPVNIFAVNWHDLTPLDLARHNNFRDLGDLLEASDLNWLQQEKARTATSANAILVGAALVAAAAFGAWLKPLGGMPNPDSGAPTPSSPASSSSPSSDRFIISGFYFGIAFAFSFSVVSLAYGILATFSLPRSSLRDELRLLRQTLNLARRFLQVALGSFVFAFVFAFMLVFHKVASRDIRYYRQHRLQHNCNSFAMVLQ